MLVLAVFILLGCSGGDKVALVNGTAISREDLDRELNQMQGQIAEQGYGMSETEIVMLTNDLLNQLIQTELLYQETQKQKMKADEEKVNELFTQIRDGFYSEAQFRDTLSQANLTKKKILAQIEKDTLIESLLEDQMKEYVPPTDAEIREYYENNPVEFSVPRQVRASHVLIMLDQGASRVERSEGLSLIQEAQERLRKGEDFASVAKELSQGPSAPGGGDLGYFAEADMVESFSKAAFAMEIGEVSNIVESEFGFHIILVKDIVPGSSIPFDEVSGRIAEYLDNTGREALMDAYTSSLWEKAEIETFPAE